MSAGYTGHKPPNGGTADEQELQEALRLSMEVKNDAPNGTGSQSNSTTEVGGTQSRSTVSAEDEGRIRKSTSGLYCDCYAATLVPYRLPGTDAHGSVWNEISTKVGTFLLHKRVQRITPVHSCTPGFPPH